MPLNTHMLLKTYVYFTFHFRILQAPVAGWGNGKPSMAFKKHVLRGKLS